MSSHLYLIGRTGTGKTTLMRGLIIQDIRGGGGLLVLDPHGDLYEDLKGLEGEHERLIFLDPLKEDFALNLLSDVPLSARPLRADAIVSVFKKLWSDAWGSRLEHILRYALLVLLDTQGLSLAHLPRFLTESAFRSSLVKSASSQVVRNFWEREFAGYSEGVRGSMVAPVLNKIGAFLADPTLLRIISAKGSSLNLREAMDGGQALIVNLSKGRLGEGPAGLLGSLLVSEVALAGLSRAASHRRRLFTCYLDEFQSFATDFLSVMLSELRKYGVGLVMAHQYLGQLDAGVRDAVIGNAGSIGAFRIGASDAPLLAREFAPRMGIEDLITLPNRQLYLKLMVDGVVSLGFGVTVSGQ